MRPLTSLRLIISLIIVFATAGCFSLVNERHSTESYLHTTVEEFPTGQGPDGFDILPNTTPISVLNVKEQQFSGPDPKSYYETIRSVHARSPKSGVEYEAFLGWVNIGEKEPTDKLSRITRRYIRQSYGSHHGATYYPQSVFIGRREDGLLNPILIFPDVGSHTTAPYAFSIDSKDRCHLAVADVNIPQDNKFDLYWVIGDLQTGKWINAWLIEKRGFTSFAQPRSVAWGDSVHLLWNWVKDYDGGLFHVEWSPSGFTRKLCIMEGNITAWDVAIDSRSGLLLVIFTRSDGVYGATKSCDGVWSRPVLIQDGKVFALSLECHLGIFVLRTGEGKNTREFAISIP